MTSVFNTDILPPYNHDLFETYCEKNTISTRVGTSLLPPLWTGHRKQLSLRQTMVRHTQHRSQPTELLVLDTFFNGNTRTLPVPSCHVNRRKHEGWDTARLPKPRQGKSSGGGRIRTTDLPVNLHTAAGVGVQRLKEGQEFTGNTFAPQSLPQCMTVRIVKNLHTAAGVGVQRLKEGQEFTGNTFAPQSLPQCMTVRIVKSSFQIKKLTHCWLMCYSFDHRKAGQCGTDSHDSEVRAHDKFGIGYPHAEGDSFDARGPLTERLDHFC
ncbi:hypothetical protein T265_06685 [Opisthorchis viverrini]|uniref:Uncharacterized protein n=1 Tax=Opisthorchis viverrini TaxID=6198 RepID=A0A074ZRM1_OPIVI|nr:hypothetical protein T265_06685 [Opisthorchis viverrini]KER25995.1 hypothetical protein T265_06685 [Opisthorchis viverrini]